MKKETLKITLFIAGLLLIQAFISDLSMPPEIKNFRKYLKNGVDCLYFCDSVMRFYTRGDTGKKPIIDLIKDSKPGFTIEAVDHPAYNLDIYYSYCRAILDSKKRPKAVIIPVSLYSLSAEWLRPSYKFELEQAALQSSSILNRLFYRNIAALKKKPITTAQFLDTPVYLGDIIAGKVRDFDNKSFEKYSDDNFRKKIISRYMYYADENNPKIQSLEKIMDIMKDSGVIMVFYIPPVDYETCGDFYGPEFLKTVDRNIAFVAGKVRAGGCEFLDYSRLLKKDSFAWKETFYVNEHLDYKGRSGIAAALAADMGRIFTEKKINPAGCRKK
jgi:hypothetical protein